MSDTEYQSGTNIIVATQNLGTGVPLTNTTGIQNLTLQVKSLVAGNGCSISTSANNVQISSIPDPSSQLFTTVDDMIGQTSIGNVFGNLNCWIGFDQPTATGHNNISSTGHPGIAVFGTGSATTGMGFATLGSSSMFPANGVLQTEMDIRLPTTSNAGARYTFRTGLCDGLGPNPSSAIANGYWFEYNDGPTSSCVAGNWVIVSASAGQRTYLDSGISVIGNTWYKLITNSGANYSPITTSINGTATSSITLTIPTPGQALTAFFSIGKQTGTTDSLCHIDFVKLHQVFNVAR